jgi:protein-disulfide isomerase
LCIRNITMSARTFACVVALVVIMSSVMAQAPIPYRPDGYAIGPYTAPVVVDAFVDVLCPDCAAEWPTLMQLTQHYGNSIQLLAHTFPLPYHTNGFIASQGVHVIARYTNSTAKVVSYMTNMFKSQSAWWNDPTRNVTINAVIASLSAWVAELNIGVSAAAFTSGINDDDINEETRVSWKYGCSRGVLGTPTFLLNGVYIPADSTWTLADWQTVIDPLLTAPPVIPAPATAAWSLDPPPTCKPGEKLCNYSPNKYECCTPGEGCIPNVGCRCDRVIGCSK